MTHPFQPQALRDNPVSNAYFGALRQRASAATALCAHCGRDLREVPRMSDGQRVWCDVGHHELWLRGQRDAAMRIELTRRGWSEDRQRAADGAAG